MDVNANAGCLNTRDAPKSIASRLAPTVDLHGIRRSGVSVAIDVDCAGLFASKPHTGNAVVCEACTTKKPADQGGGGLGFAHGRRMRQ